MLVQMSKLLAGGCGWSIYEDAGITGGSIPQSSIVNGWEARPFEFPWQVMFLQY